MATRQRQTRTTVWDGQKAISLDQFPPQAWTDLSLSAAGSNDSRADREAMQNFYETVAVLFRCIELRQVGISRVPWAIVRNGKDIWIDSEPEPPSQLAYLKDFRRLLQLTEAALCLSPEAFWFVEQNRARPLALRWHAPASVIPQWSATKGLTGFKRLLGQGQSRIFEPEDYVYFALPNPFHETIPGRPPAQTALGSAGVLYFVDAFVGKFIERGAIKATLFTAPRGTATTERDRLLAWLKRNLTGIKQAFSTEVITDDVKPITVGEGLENLSQSELTMERKQDIATALGVPHSLVFSNAANFATARQDDIHFYDKTIVPSFSRLTDIVNRQLLEPQGYSLELRPESMSIFQTDEHERSTSVQSLVNAGMELDLAMEILGYDLTDEQWARVKAPKPEPPPPPPVMIAPSVSAPENATEQPIIDTADKTAEIALLRRWASKRKHPVPADFQSQLLTDAEKTIIIAEVSSGKDFFGVAGKIPFRANWLNQ